MTTPTPMARAVEAFKTYAPCCECTSCVQDGLRAAGPLYLEAVVGEVGEGDLVEVWLKGEYGGKAHKVATENMRTALLVALKDAAGRVW